MARGPASNCVPLHSFLFNCQASIFYSSLPFLLQVSALCALFYIRKHFSSVLSKSCVINHAWQIPGWGRRKRIVLFIWGVTNVTEALVSLELSVSIFWCTPLSFCQACSVFMPFSISFFYEMYSASLCQVPCEISLMHKVQRALKKSPHLVLFGEHWSILSCLKFPLRLYCEDRAVWAKLMGEGSKRDDKYKVLHQPTTHSQCGIGREKKIGIMEKSWTGLVEWE